MFPTSITGVIRFGLEPFLLLIFCQIVIKKIVQKEPLKFGKVSLFILLFSIIGLISNLLNSNNMVIYILGVRPFIRYYLFYLIIINLKNINIKRIFCLITITFTFEVGLGILQVYFPVLLSLFSSESVVLGKQVIKGSYENNYSDIFIFGSLGRYNIYANYLVHIFLFILPFYLYKVFYSKVNNKILPLLLISLVAIVFTNSRTSLISLLIGGIVIFLLYRKLTPKIIFSLFGLFLLALVFLMIGVSFEVEFFNRFTTIFTSEYISQSLKTDRLHVLFYILPFILQSKPFFGFGPGEVGSDVTGGTIGSQALFNTTDFINNPFLSDVGHVALIAQTGLIGYLAYGLIFLYSLKVSLSIFKDTESSLYKSIAMGLFLNLCVIFFENFSSFNIIYRPISAYLWIMIGILFYIKLNTKEKKYDKNIND
ncbi:O-antigen ligase family protein [Peribacillus muralis]|uniref:O-antigen ligase family protein n=1 Tax=Peribacillus muralis TaxID=264697 RepID=UPI00137947ED|nr:O-antigen ligase family protein [Peribacillus muralis]